MKSSNRLLLGFGIAIAVVVVVAIVVVLVTARGEVSLLPEDTPEGTVQRFILAVQDGDYPKAYSYLRLEELGQVVPYERWKDGLPRPPTGRAWKVTLGKTAVSGDDATIDLIVEVFTPRPPLEDPLRDPTSRWQTAYRLTRINGSWLITSHPDLSWLYWR